MTWRGPARFYGDSVAGCPVAPMAFPLASQLPGWRTPIDLTPGPATRLKCRFPSSSRVPGSTRLGHRFRCECISTAFPGRGTRVCEQYSHDFLAVHTPSTG